ncbi:MAG: class I SAM-dependent methyltransferase [Lachnospiraceae bacterium]
MIEEKLNLTYYSGTDLYSDGEVEDELLEAAQHKEDIPKMLREGNSWPHLYHLSNMRENLLDWYDFDPDGTLLEIGAGCGALTGLFCRKTKHVTAIDLSKKRSTINATRNEDCDNLEIYVGNFEDIKLDQKFDYVTLIGVFEYSICYVNSKNPFLDMLKKAQAFLKPGGKLFIAIENKYGLKYFAGAREDHTGELFDGIENYHNVERVRTFSRNVLEDMLRQVGFRTNEFYYPMPDYKLPTQIFSDSYLPKPGDLRALSVAYDRDRYMFFNEAQAFGGICEDGLFPMFANSFLVISSK